MKTMGEMKKGAKPMVEFLVPNTPLCFSLSFRICSEIRLTEDPRAKWGWGKERDASVPNYINPTGLL